MRNLQLTCFMLLSLWTACNCEICKCAVCKFELVVRWDRTMVYVAQSRNGVSYNTQWRDDGGLEIVANMYHPADDPLVGTNVSDADVHVVDGFPRGIITINGEFPAPTLEVMEGAQVVVKVVNELDTEGLTVHFHGIHQRNTPYADGVPYVTQCPVMPGQEYEHKFIAHPVGTHWYHSHFSSQRTDGLFGMFIVHKEEPIITNYPVVVTDWYHVPGVVIETTNPYNVDHPGAGEYEFRFFREYTAPTIYGTFYTGVPPMNVTEAPPSDPPDFPPNPYGPEFDSMFITSTLVNGRGRYDEQKLPLTTFDVTSGGTYRFRMVHAGSLPEYVVRLDQHKMRLVAVDGNVVTPMELDFFFITPGERVDVEVTMDQTPSKYWFRVLSGPPAGVFGASDAKGAIINYTDNSNTVQDDPAGYALTCSQDAPCLGFNCPNGTYPSSANTFCYTLDQARAVDDRRDLYMPPDGEEIVEVFLNSAFNYGANVNGIILTGPRPTPDSEGSTVIACTDEDCADGCQCTHIVNLPFNRTIQMVFSNFDEWDTGGPVGHHPSHLHGYSFAVVAMGYGTIDLNTQSVTAPNYDIACVNKFCRNPVWRYGPPSLNLDHPPVKDTLIVPSHGYAVVRFRSDNPGIWMLHCHIDSHANVGMGLVVNTDTDGQLHPEKLPKCGFNYDHAWTASESSSSSNTGANKEMTFPLWLFVVMLVGAALAGVLITFLVAVACQSGQRRRRVGSAESSKL